MTKQVLQQALEALELAVRQNSHDMLMTGEEIRKGESAIEALRSALAQQPELSTASKSEQLLASHDHALRAEFQRMKAALSHQGEQQPDGLPLVISGAIFDFAGYLTTRPKVIEVGSAANASPMVELIKEWADLRGLSLDDAAVQSWQEWLPTGAAPAAQPTCKQDLQVETEQERYVRMCPDIECGRKKRCTRMVGVSCMSRADIAPAAQPELTACGRMSKS